MAACALLRGVLVLNCSLSIEMTQFGLLLVFTVSSVKKRKLLHEPSVSTEFSVLKNNY